MPRRDGVHNASSGDLVSKFLVGPLADRPPGRGRSLTGQGHDLADLLRRDPIRAGAPGRGASASRSAMPKSASGISWSAAQRSRHNRTLSRLSPTSPAVSAMERPSPAASTIRARLTTCCPVLCRRTTASKPWRSSMFNEIGRARMPIPRPFLRRRVRAPCPPLSLLYRQLIYANVY